MKSSVFFKRMVSIVTSNDNELTMPDDLKGSSKSKETKPDSKDEPVDFLAKHDLYPTEVEQPSPDQAVLTLNGELSIRRISLPDDQTPYVEWPKSSRDQKDDQNTIWFDEMDLKQVLATIVSRQETSEESGPDLDLTVDRFHSYEEDNLLGFIDVEVNGVFTIKGAKLMVTDGEEWISWPAEKDEGEWINLFSPSDEAGKRLLEAVLEERG